MKVTDKMLNDILNFNPEKEGALLSLPGVRFPGSNQSGKIVQTHIKNLILTYGVDAVIYHVTEVIKEEV